MRNYCWIFRAKMPKYAKFSDGHFDISFEIVQQSMGEKVRKIFNKS